MFLSYSERLDAESRGTRAGETKGGLYDSTPPHYFGACPKRATEWRNAYALAYTEARQKRGI